jgi:nucleoside-diphosphate-sugar epimerase
MNKIETRIGGKRILVAGGAGFIGSHLCEALVRQGHRVTCLDSFLTGARGNLDALTRAGAIELIEHDICDPLPPNLQTDAVYNLACAASPPRYQANPVHTMMTSVVGANRLLEHAQACGARLLQASTSEVYGDPEEHPQRETYWGNVNPTGPRACYDEGKRAPRRFASTTSAPAARTCASRASSTPTARGCAATTGGSSQTSSARRSAPSRSPSTGRASRPAPSATSPTSSAD